MRIVDRMAAAAAATWLALPLSGGGVAFLLHDYRCWRVRAILHSLRPGVNTGLNSTLPLLCTIQAGTADDDGLPYMDRDACKN